jgi:hypothetical protein
MLEPELPEGCFVLGVDEHTGVVIDLDADTAEIVGKGAVTLRRNGQSVRLEAGQTIPIDALRAGPTGAAPTGAATPGSDLGPSRTTGATAPGSDLGLRRITDAAAEGSDLGLTPGPSVSTAAAGAVGGSQAPDSLAGAAKLHEAAFGEALDARDADAAVAAILELESAIVEWSRDTLQSDDIDRARAALRSMIVRLGAAATEGVRDTREVLGPVVEAALAARVVARSEKAFAVSDAIRDELTAAGIEVRDTPDGAEWLIADD